MYDTYHHYIYLWYPLVLCPVDFSERASAECAWGSSTTASFPEKKCGESKSNASVYSDLPIYIYNYICIHIHTMHTSTICLIEVSARRKQLYPAPPPNSSNWRPFRTARATMPESLTHGLPTSCDKPPFTGMVFRIYMILWCFRMFFLADSGWVHAKVNAEFLVLCSIVFLLYKCLLSILINICTRNFILLLKKKRKKRVSKES